MEADFPARASSAPCLSPASGTPCNRSPGSKKISRSVFFQDRGIPSATVLQLPPAPCPSAMPGGGKGYAGKLSAVLRRRRARPMPPAASTSRHAALHPAGRLAVGSARSAPWRASCAAPWRPCLASGRAGALATLHGAALRACHGFTMQGEGEGMGRRRSALCGHPARDGRDGEGGTVGGIDGGDGRDALPCIPCGTGREVGLCILSRSAVIDGRAVGGHAPAGTASGRGSAASMGGNVEALGGARLSSRGRGRGAAPALPSARRSASGGAVVGGGGSRRA